jgi:hypothetical protein
MQKKPTLTRDPLHVKAPAFYPSGLFSVEFLNPSSGQTNLTAQT